MKKPRSFHCGAFSRKTTLQQPSYDDALVQLLLLSYDALQPRRSPIKVVRSVTEPVSRISVALNGKRVHSFGKKYGACRNFI